MRDRSFRTYPERRSFPENFTSLRVKFSFLFFGSFFSFFRKKRKNTASELRGSSFMSFRVASELRAREARLASASLGGSVSWQLRCLGFSQQSQLPAAGYFFCSVKKTELLASSKATIRSALLLSSIRQSRVAVSLRDCLSLLPNDRKRLGKDHFLPSPFSAV